MSPRKSGPTLRFRTSEVQAKEKPNVVILSKMAPTTKVCTNCGTYHDNMKLWDRTFECDCGYSQDRAFFLA